MILDRIEVYHAVEAEVTHQEAKWGKNTDPARAGQHVLEWFAILAEEVGELAKEVNEVHFRAKDPAELERELIQVAAVAVSWLEARGVRV